MNKYKNIPGSHGDKVVSDDKCGLHVHFDADCLANDPKRMRIFLRLYAESEELLYKICNEKGNPIRKNAINRNFKFGLNLISSIWRSGMASPSSKKILKQIENGTLKVSYKKFGILKMIAGKYKIDERRYSGLNLTNIGNPKKDTIEFRMSNGTLNPEAIKQNIFLYASLINTAINIADNPKKYEQQLNEFYKTDVTEAQKLNSFLNLIMQKTEDRKIYFERWQSVKDASVFKNNHKKGFAKQRFQHDEFKRIAERTPSQSIHEIYLYIKQSLKRSLDKGDMTYDR